MAFGWCLCLCW
uniref:Uncharacterized protein n=1 Tax=Arundo donax TaxID=35708 RepID=A0A0A9CIQ0_ARUDO